MPTLPSKDISHLQGDAEKVVTPSLFDDGRSYQPIDPEMAVIGNPEKLSQWRHRNIGPAFYRLGRKIIYHGTDLNRWVADQRVEPEAA